MYQLYKIAVKQMVWYNDYERSVDLFNSIYEYVSCIKVNLKRTRKVQLSKLNIILPVASFEYQFS